MFKKALIDIFTGKDNQTFDLGRFLWAIACLDYTVIVTFESIMHGIDPITLATGFTIILGGGAGALALKYNTEPNGDNNVKNP